MDKDPTFADTFPPPDEARWRALVASALKGAAFETLVTHTPDGMAIQPLYQRAAEERPRAWRAVPGPWRVAARADHPDTQIAAALARDDLQGGVDTLHLVYQDAPGARGFGLPGSPDSIETLLNDVPLDGGVAIEMDAGRHGSHLARTLAQFIDRRGFDPARTHICFGLDPLGAGAIDGGLSAPWDETVASLAATAKFLSERGFAGPICIGDGRIVHAGGGTPAQELAFAIAAAIAYLRALEAAKTDIDAAREMIGFRMAADAEEFICVAKFRALRRLWSRVEAACGLDPRPVHIHAETAWRMMARRDPWVNLPRATVACFSAGLGGADAISVLPFTQALGLPDALARRIARNSQAILVEELNLGRVADPAAGAGGFEALTDGLCEKAWALIQDIERAGGLPTALAAGTFQADVAQARAARESGVARREFALTGVSEFPDIHEAPVDTLAPWAPAARAPMAIVMDRLEPSRDAEPFERLRDAADVHASATGKRFSIFLANLGPRAAFGARAMFAKNLFEAGGIEAIDTDGFADDSSLAAAFARSGATLACLCSSDPIYATRATAAAQALAAAGARRVYLAGRPNVDGGLGFAGVDDFVFAGRDVLELLAEAARFAT